MLAGERLVSETAGENERRLDPRRIRARARRTAPSTSEAHLEQMLHLQRRLEDETPEERETRLAQDLLTHHRRLEAEPPKERETRLAQNRFSNRRLKHQRRGKQVLPTSDLDNSVSTR